MKYSAALSLAMAPLALAKAVHNVYPVQRDPLPAVRRDGHKSGGSSKNASPVSPEQLAQLGLSGAGINGGSITQADVIIIWVNGGNGVPTTQVNPQQTVTVTQTIVANPGGGAGAGATPPAAAPAPPGSPPVAAPGAAATHAVNVGGPKGLQFEPQEIKAAVGDMVIFTFLSQNHTATQSAFDTPCDPLAGGMDSGFQANANNSVNPPPQVAMQVMVETPLWFYCRQANHCGKGMVFSINPTAAKTHAMFQGLAIAQKGTGAGGAITGNPPPGAAPPAAAPPAAPAAPGAAPPAAAPAAPGTGPTVGTGQLNADGSCSCAVVCGAGSFPAVQAQGIGAFGGMAGSIPASMAGL